MGKIGAILVVYMGFEAKCPLKHLRHKFHDNLFLKQQGGACRKVYFWAGFLFFGGVPGDPRKVIVRGFLRSVEKSCSLFIIPYNTFKGSHSRL